MGNRLRLDSLNNFSNRHRIDIVNVRNLWHFYWLNIYSLSNRGSVDIVNVRDLWYCFWIKYLRLFYLRYNSYIDFWNSFRVDKIWLYYSYIRNNYSRLNIIWFNYLWNNYWNYRNYWRNFIVCFILCYGFIFNNRRRDKNSLVFHW